MPLIKASDPATEEPHDAGDGAHDVDVSQALASQDVEMRRAAVRAALRAGDVALLVGHLDVESDRGIREAILNGVVRRRDPAQASPLLDLLRSEDAFLRNAAIDTLQIMGDEILPEIERLLDDADSDVRIFCVNILQAIRSPRVPDIALRVATTDHNVNVCAAAVEVLAELGRPEMSGALQGVAARFPTEPFLGFAVRAALKRIG